MKNDLETSNVLFHNRARKVFFSLYSEFQQRSKQSNRSTAEDQYQQLQGKYVVQFRQYLLGIAHEIIDRQAPQAGQNDPLRHSLSQLIDEYVNSFAQKLQAL